MIPQSLLGCRACEVFWPSLADLLADGDVGFLGYQGVAGAGMPGRLIFTHRRCGASLEVELVAFQQFTAEPLLSQCSPWLGRCQAAVLGQPCPLKCTCAFLDRVVRMIRHYSARHPKG
jgi:hypothetical protein